MVVPVPFLVEIELARCLYHCLEMRVRHVVGVGGRCVVLGHAWFHGHDWRAGRYLGQLGEHAVLQMGVDGGVVEVDRGQDDVQQGFGALELALQGLDVLGGGIAPAVRGLVVGAGKNKKSISGGARRARRRCHQGAVTILRRVSTRAKATEAHAGGGHAHGGCRRTIAVDGAMGAGLLAVALDLLAPALVAGTRYSASFLGLGLWCLIVADVIGL